MAFTPMAASSRLLKIRVRANRDSSRASKYNPPKYPINASDEKTARASNHIWVHFLSAPSETQGWVAFATTPPLTD